jgi:FAD synthetase
VSEPGFKHAEIADAFGDLEKEGLLEYNKKGRIQLTEKGRRRITVVMTGGAFDVIHPGHLETLEKSKSFGDVLVVSVARNSTFERNKGRKPINDESIRRKLVASIKCVDAAVLGSEKDIFEVVELLKPDIITLGYDQAHSEGELREQLKRRGINAKVLRLTSSVPSIKTSKLIAENTSLLGDL